MRPEGAILRRHCCNCKLCGGFDKKKRPLRRLLKRKMRQWVQKHVLMTEED